jgi:hypothetical protein
MVIINVKTNIDAVIQQLDRRVWKQVPYATARALTATAKDVQRALTEAIPQVFDRPTPFTQRAIGMTWATKNTLRSKVFIKDVQAGYLRLQVSGGTEFPKKRALVVPAGVALNAYGNMTRNKLRSLLNRKDVFSGRVRGVPGIWQRVGGRVKLLIAYEPQARYQARFSFLAIAKRTVARTLLPNFRSALAAAMRTAR